MVQTSIYDQIEAKKNAGIELVFAHADTKWKKAAAAQLLEVAKTKTKFTSDDIIMPLEAQGIVTKDNRAISAILKSAQKLNLIQGTESYVTCRRPSRHHAPVMLWKSLMI